MKLWLLGTGTPTPSVNRMCSSYLIEAGGDYILFDHGFGSHHRLLELGVPATRISHAFFSHHHYDHMGDYPRLVLTRWDQGAGLIPELKVYGPPPLQRITELLFSDEGAFGPDLISRTENQASIDVFQARGGKGKRTKPRPVITELAPDSVLSEKEWTVRVVPVNHFAPHLISYGYRIEHNGQSIVYSGDSGPCRALNALAKDCDVLVHMCHYLSGTAPSKTFAAFAAGHMEVAEAAAEANAKSIVISHVAEQFDKPGLRERVIADISRVYSGNIFFGSDGMQIPVDGPTVNKLD